MRVTVREAVKKTKRKQEPRKRWGVVTGSVPGDRTRCVVTCDGVPMRVRNIKASHNIGTPVELEYKPGRGWQVVGLAEMSAAYEFAGLGVPPHYESHLWMQAGLPGGSDPVFIHPRQLLHLRVESAGGMVVHIREGYVLGPGYWIYVASQNLDISGDIPVSGALWTLITVDAGGLVSSTPGTAVTAVTDLKAEDIPVPGAGAYAMAAVKLYAGQTDISENPERAEIITLSESMYSPVVLQQPAHMLYTTTGAVAYPATAAGITSMLAASVSGDHPTLYPGGYTGDYTVPDGVSLDGPGYAGATIYGTVTLGAGSSLNNLAVSCTKSGSTEAVGVIGPASTGASIQQCTIVVTQTGTGNARSVKLNGAVLGMRDCYLRATAAGGGATATCIYSPGAIDDVIAEYCVLANATTIDAAPASNWSMASGTNVEIYHCVKQGASSVSGDSSNYTEIGTDGSVLLVGGATQWEDLRIEPTARGTGVNVPAFEKYYDDAAGTSRGVYLYSFTDEVANNEKELYFTMQMPHAWAGTGIYMHVHWVGAVADTTAAPRWGMEYAWEEIGATYGDTSIIYTDGKNYNGTGDDANITANKHYLSAFAVVIPTATQDGLSSILIGRLFRNSSDAADTYNAAGAKCGLLYIDAHYEVNSFGSREEYSK